MTLHPEPFDPERWRGLPLIAHPAKLQAIINSDWETRQQFEAAKAKEYHQNWVREPAPQVHPDAFNFAPWGDRLVIVREKALGRTGGIVIPDSSRGFPASGWVLSVGEGVDDPRLGVRSCPYNRARLLGCKVIFGVYASQVLIVRDDNLADNFRSAYGVLDVGSIWGITGEPPNEVPL